MLFSIIIWVIVLWGITLVVNTKRFEKAMQQQYMKLRDWLSKQKTSEVSLNIMEFPQSKFGVGQKGITLKLQLCKGLINPPAFADVVAPCTLLTGEAAPLVLPNYAFPLL